MYPYLFYLFIIVTAVNVCYYFFFYRFAFAKANTTKALSKNLNPALPPISVIVCAKNEAENLKKHIPKLLEQDYPEFQIVFINDASSDDTEEVMEQFALSDKRVKQVNVVNVEAFWGNKKYALTLGVKAAAYEHLLFTDADCVPATSNWIREMARGFSQEKEIVLGYGGYEKVKGSLLNQLIRYETLFTAVQYFSYAIGGKPYMGVGRNLAYTTNLFYEQRGFINHIKIRSGDDDLFVNQAATSQNTTAIWNYESFTISKAKKSYRAWFTQKRRHVNVAKYYKWTDKFLLAIFYSSQLLFFLSAFLILFTSFQWEICLAIIGLRYLIAWIAVGVSAYRLQEKDCAWFFPLNELFLIFFQLSIFSANLISKPNRWK
ncbi:glycosyltransferase [Dokdonia sinensis]|uniref:Glycosyltransferase n=1 Tax=Dokdonia sinensis TaxID=2479847 RepID=A0A3M0H3B4_9FLAO|nr:glycosyltransferase [Dokdonia sinensis]RMB64186.1 glycosyltransferase [Dokdonia sinensis]